MERNSSIFNFRTLPLHVSPAAILAVLLFAGSQLAALRWASGLEDGAKQIVEYKRIWARSVIPAQNPAAKRILFMGDSKITSGLVPDVFDQMMGGTTESYNFSLPGLSLAPHYFLLRDYLRKNTPPDAIVMKPKSGGFHTPYFPMHAGRGARIAEALQYAFFGRSPSVLMNYFVPSRQSWPALRDYIMGLLLDHVPPVFRKRHRMATIDKLRKKETYPHDWDYFYEMRYVKSPEHARWKKRQLSLKRGYYYFQGHAAMGGGLPDGYVPNDAPEKEAQRDPFVRLFFDLTKSKGIPVFFIQDYTMKEAVEQEVPAFWKSIKKQYPNIFFSEKGYAPKVYPPSLFADPEHLNPGGAEKFTRAVALEFKRAMNF